MASSFVDKARISVHAGKGGDGAVAFHREKYVAAGGPDGGDGGRGGNIVFTVDENMSTLMDFRYKRKYVAGNGANGAGKRCYGKDGETLYIKVPRGTIVRDTETGAIMHDMSTGEDKLSIGSLGAKTLGLAVAAVLGGTHAFFMCHSVSPPFVKISCGTNQALIASI